jgi:hypothetical protein
MRFGVDILQPLNFFKAFLYEFFNFNRPLLCRKPLVLEAVRQCYRPKGERSMMEDVLTVVIDKFCTTAANFQNQPA